MKTKKSDRQRELEKEMIKNVWKSWVIYSPFLFGFMALAISLSLGFFIVGFTGVIVAVRKEMPSGWGTIRGPMAIVVGVLTTILFWGLAVFFFLIEVLKWRF